MKNKINLITIMLVLITGSFALAQDKVQKIKTTEFKVAGVCDMCKSRIEQASLIKGVRITEWNKHSQTLKVTYSTKKTDEETIHKAVAAVGHDTNLHKANNSVYDELPGCCQYRGDVEVH